MWPLHRRWVVHLLSQLDVLAIERAGLARPRSFRDLEQFLEHLEALGDRRITHAKCPVLALVPCGTDAEVRPARREDVERGGLLDEDRRVAIGDPGHQGSESDPVGRGRQDGEHHPAFHKGVLPAPQLDEVVPDPERVEAGVLGALADAGEVVAHLLRAARPVVLVDLKTELHLTAPQFRPRRPVCSSQRSSRSIAWSADACSHARPYQVALWRVSKSLVAQPYQRLSRGGLSGKAHADEYRRQLDILDLTQALGEKAGS